MDELQAVDAAHGASLRSRNLATVEGTTAMASRRLAVGGEVEGIQSMDRRVHGDLGAQAMNAFDAAVVSTDSQALQGILGWLPAQGLQRAATAASGSMSAEQRQFYSARAENAGFGDPEAMLVQALLRLGDETTRLQGAASGRGAPPTKIADGSRVELGASTVAALAAAVRTPTAPTDGRTPSEPRR